MLFSVIVPTYNRLNLLKKTLESIWNQEGADFETIVVNDGSSDGTHEYLSQLSSSGKVKYFFHPNKGLAATRSEGLHHAQGTFIAFTDDDCVVPVNWLNAFKKKFDREGADGVGGACVTGNSSNWFAVANDMMQNYFKDVLNNKRGGVPFFTGNNVAYKRSVLEHVGGPDERFQMGAEDRDLVFRVFNSGATLVYDPSIIVRHFNDANFSRFIRHHIQFGKGSYLYYHVTTSSGRRPSASSPGTYVGMLRYPWGKCSFLKALALDVLIVMAQSAVVWGYCSEALISSSQPSTADNAA